MVIITPRILTIISGKNLYFYISRFFTWLLVLCCFSPRLAAQTDPFLKSANLWREYNISHSDSTKIQLLVKLATISTNFLDDEILADSISDIAIRIAEKNTSPVLRIVAYNNYIESVDLNNWNYKKAIGYANNALQLCSRPGAEDLEWRTMHNLVAIYLSKRNYDSATIQSDLEMALAERLNNPVYKIESSLDLGMCLEGHQKKMDALHMYLPALSMAEEINDLRLLKKCYARLADYYNLIRTFDKAIEFKRKEQVILLTEPGEIDSVELMWTQNQKHIIISRFNNLLDNKNVEQVIDYSIRTKNIRLKNFEFAIYRKYLIETDKMDQLYRVYNVKYPEELKIISLNDVGNFYRLKAFFKDVEGQHDSAYCYFLLAEQKIRDNPNLLFRSTFYIRFGQFLKREGRFHEAIEMFTKAYQLAEADHWFGYMEFMLTASLQLSDLYALTGDFAHAYYYSEENSWLSNNISVNANKEKADRLLLEYKIKLDSEKRVIQLRQSKNERMLMAGGIAFLFIVSLLIFRNFMNQKKSNKLLDAAKKKSDDLLLNILPVETAEELKLYGAAKAKRFEEVTVMFTDFKDFTQASEELSAEELVEKIHFYFSEFDRIIEKYGIEKIKIIGDSYMCVGGLPVCNETHAYDVVCAALELQELMIEQKSHRSNLGKTFFELRIGIHTGPVIAGIVGRKKFAYDIWGDTVNTASRMENCGEVNKVNISGSTFEKIKEHFVCIYRGKVLAKHKGEIDMYFVESHKSRSI
jgi:class 3 adenylate cyclase